MTDATIHIFVDELKKLNPGEANHIKVGRGIDRMIYTGGDPRELISPAPFSWDESLNGFSDLEAIREMGTLELYQLFTVSDEDN